MYVGVAIRILPLIIILVQVCKCSAIPNTSVQLQINQQQNHSAVANGTFYAAAFSCCNVVC